MKQNKKVFETLYHAEEFAKKVNGNVQMQQLPNYNYVDIVYIVTW